MAHDHALGKARNRLVDQRRLDDLLAETSVAEIAEAWSCYVQRDVDDFDDADWWAVEFWLASGLAFEREEVTRDGLLALVLTVPDQLLGHLGAGPLENFIGPDESRIVWIEEQAAASPRFRAALANNVWAWDSEEDWVAERLEKAAGVALKRPRW